MRREFTRPKFIHKVQRVYKSVIERQLTKAILLSQVPRDKVMNSMSDWGFIYYLNSYQQEEMSQTQTRGYEPAQIPEQKEARLVKIQSDTE